MHAWPGRVRAGARREVHAWLGTSIRARRVRVRAVRTRWLAHGAGRCAATRHYVVDLISLREGRSLCSGTRNGCCKREVLYTDLVGAQRRADHPGRCWAGPRFRLAVLRLGDELRSHEFDSPWQRNFQFVYFSVRWRARQSRVRFSPPEFSWVRRSFVKKMYETVYRKQKKYFSLNSELNRVPFSSFPWLLKNRVNYLKSTWVYSKKKKKIPIFVKILILSGYCFTKFLKRDSSHVLFSF
jgi:hypothetical protein